MKISSLDHALKTNDLASHFQGSIALSKRGPAVRQSDGHFGICNRRGDGTWVGS